MKQIIIALALLLTISAAHSQMSCQPNGCSTELHIPISSPNDWNNNNGNLYPDKSNSCFVGDGTINNSLNFNGVVNFNFNGNINVNKTINLAGNQKIYVPSGKSVTILNLSMNGGDTIFLAGQLSISTIGNVNNSTAGHRAVIVLQAGATVKINGVSYAPASTYQALGGLSNQIDVIPGCTDTLGLKWGDLKVEKIGVNSVKVSVTVYEATNVKQIEIQMKNLDGHDAYRTVTVFPASNGSENRTYSAIIKIH